MGICPNCGEWVDDGDICMCCGGSGYGNDDYDGICFSGGSSSYTPPSNEELLRRKKERYERYLNYARSEENFPIKMERYNKAIDYFEEYLQLSKRFGMGIEGMPSENNMLPETDLKWIGERHYKSQTKFSLFGNTEKAELEKLLNRSGNANVIRDNQAKLQKEREAQSRQYRIDQAKNERKWYFEHIKKANRLVYEDNFKKAMKEYRNAGSCWESYFKYDYEKDPDRDMMPEDRFTSDAVEHMMVMYVETHPILTSNKKKIKINREILEMLDGKWDDEILEADRKAQDIYNEKQMKRKETVKKVGEAIGDVMIFADNMLQRIRK